jgi:hypothetical protein
MAGAAIAAWIERIIGFAGTAFIRTRCACGFGICCWGGGGAGASGMAAGAAPAWNGAGAAAYPKVPRVGGSAAGTGFDWPGAVAGPPWL